MNTMTDTFHFDVASPPQSNINKRKQQRVDDEECSSKCVTPTPPTYSPYNDSPHKITRIFRRSQQSQFRSISPPPLRRMTDEDRMNMFAASMEEQDLPSFLSLPTLSSGGSTTTQEQHDTFLLPASSLPTIFNLSQRTTLAPRCFALPELEIMKSRSLFDDNEDSDSDDSDVDDDDDDDDLTPPLLQTCRSFDSDIDDNIKNDDNDFFFERQRNRAQSPLKTLFRHSEVRSNGSVLQMRKTPNNQSLIENSKQLKIELSLPKKKMDMAIPSSSAFHRGTPLKEQKHQHQQMIIRAVAA
jgi:hypothetical protein